MLEQVAHHPPPLSRGAHPSGKAYRIAALCLVAVVVSVHFTEYGPLIPLIQTELHLTSSQVGLLSTSLFLALATTNILGGLLVDRFGPRLVLLWSLIVLTVGAIALPFMHSFFWILACRAVIGFGSGAALVAGSAAAASLGALSPLAQGLYGGFAQVGAGLGLLVTPYLLAVVNWRGTFLVWGIVGLSALLIWWRVREEQKVLLLAAPRHAHARLPWRSVWTLGLCNLGTFGLGNAMATWLAVYFISQYRFPLTLAATLGSLALFAGMVLRPLGGMLLTRGVGTLTLMRAGTMLACAGVVVLALPTRVLYVSFIGIALLAVGTTLPYAAIFHEAARVGKARGTRAGTVQGFVAVLASPASLLGPPLIGLLFDATSRTSFTPAFACMTVFGVSAILASSLAGRALGHDTDLPEGDPIAERKAAAPERQEPASPKNRNRKEMGPRTSRKTKKKKGKTWQKQRNRRSVSYRP